MSGDYARLMAPWHGACETPDTVSPAECDEPSLEEFTAAHARANQALRETLLSRIHAHSPAFFEELVIDVVLALGYGGRRRDLAQRLGRSGDGGIDGVIELDELGLDVVYLQAKRLKPGTVVPVADVRDFAGSLDAHHASKGIVLTTSRFSDAARQFVGQLTRRVVLVDGQRLTDIMIRYNIGVRVRESFQFKRLDVDYFSPPSSSSRIRETISASIQPRR
jgi:restriction system protein